MVYVVMRDCWLCPAGPLTGVCLVVPDIFERSRKLLKADNDG
jgi:hypothetical protein